MDEMIKSSGLCSKRCRSCQYAQMLANKEPYCNYICFELKPRGCEAGDKCDKYISRRSKTKIKKRRFANG